METHSLTLVPLSRDCFVCVRTRRCREANRVKVKVGGLEQELNGRGDFRAPKANAPADFFFGAQTRDPRREKRGEVRPLSERFADPQE